MKISFCIPTFNSITWLPHSVTSALEQTHKDIEVVVVDDGSTDETGDYLSWLEKHEKRAKVIRLPKNMGRSEARNIGNKAATGDVICVLDADDIATPNRAEIIARRFKRGKVDLVYGPATCIDAIGRPQAQMAADVFDLPRAIREMTNGVVHSTLAYSRDFAVKNPYMGGEVARLGLDDWEFVIRAAISGAAIDVVPQRLACYRMLDGQITRTRDKQEVLQFKKKHLDSLMGAVVA